MKKIFSMILVIVMIFTCSLLAFAYETPTGFHKVNGTGSENGSEAQLEYESITSENCYTLKAQGSSDNNSKEVQLHIYYVEEDGTEILRAQKRVTLDTTVQTVVSGVLLKEGKYIIRVTPINKYDNVGYEVSTYFFIK